MVSVYLGFVSCPVFPTTDTVAAYHVTALPTAFISKANIQASYLAYSQPHIKKVYPTTLILATKRSTLWGKKTAPKYLMLVLCYILMSSCVMTTFSGHQQSGIHT